MSSTNNPKAAQAAFDGNLRREARVEARIKVAIVRGRRTESLETSDVSFKGLFLRTSGRPPVRWLLRLRVVLPAPAESASGGKPGADGTRQIEAHAMAVH